MSPTLYVVMYHYVRDLLNTPFPKIKGMDLADFRQQLVAFQSRYEMATLESALDFIQGRYTPSRDMCLLTFDDGLKEHYAQVTPLLAERGIQGLFFLITSCFDGRHIAPVHMNHFLMAVLDFDHYKNAFLKRLENLNESRTPTEIDPTIAHRTYRWDTPEVASFKYLFNFILDMNVRDRVLKELFEERIDDEESFAPTLYVSPNDAREMQSAGMVVGGHSHQHIPLSSLSDQELKSDLYACHEMLAARLYPQRFWPFCYPYGKKDSFDSRVARLLKDLGFVCSFSTENGSNGRGTDVYMLQRHDCKDMPIQ